MASRHALLCICNPLLDMCTTDKAVELMQKYNLKPANAILAESEHLPIYSEIASDPKVNFIAGGSGQNTARVAQWMLQSSNVTAFLGATGDDEYGRILRKTAEADGVNVCYEVSQEYPTGTCAVLVHEKDRSMVANLAAASHYSFAHFQSQEVQQVLEESKIIYITSFFLTSCPDAAFAAAKHANEKNKTLVINVSAPFLVEVPPLRALLLKLLESADYVFANETEAEALGRVQGWGSSLEEIASNVAKSPKVNAERPRTVVFTHGKDPTIVYRDGKIESYETPLVPTESIVDTNGAGDAFVGGFLSELVLGRSFPDCIKGAQYASSVIIQHDGCTYPAAPSFVRE
eukprot:TRINITY_DN2205_c0_g1_i1.p1 TRINITY_DN2205_c0_g1~~TRINITY_DN2205_c0_g1_i1.p1  ORF type:complete len:346 (-),score=90.45 TRINITY_DN2205_c0_g1_i1:210-1247(-)